MGRPRALRPLWTTGAVDGPQWLHTVLDWEFTVALACWAVLEVTQGANPWRRLLGLAVVLVVVVGRLPA